MSRQTIAELPNNEACTRCGEVVPIGWPCRCGGTVTTSVKAARKAELRRRFLDAAEKAGPPLACSDCGRVMMAGICCSDAAKKAREYARLVEPGETTVKRAITEALRILPGVEIERLQAGSAKGGRMHLAREGAADIVGCVMCEVRSMPGSTWVGRVGRFAAWEIKRPGGTTSKARAAKQSAWAERMRALGGFVTQVRTVDEAIASVERCRRWESK